VSAFKANLCQHTEFTAVLYYRPQVLNRILVQNDPINRVDPWGLCTFEATFTAVGADQLVGRPGALGFVPPNGSLAINPNSFGLPYDTIEERIATQNEIRANVGNIQISAPGLSEYPTNGTTFTIGDVGDRNIRNSPVTRFDIYRLENASGFGRQTVQVTITGLPGNWLCPTR